MSVASGSQPTAAEWQEQQDAAEAVIVLQGDHEADADSATGAEEWEML